jgi:hypothetical protein
MMRQQFASIALVALLLSLTYFSRCSSGEVKTNAINLDKFISVPFHYQDNVYYCGPAALEMVFDFYGEDIAQVEIADVARTHPYETQTDELRRAARFSNLSASFGEEMLGSIMGYSSRKVGYAAFESWELSIDDLKALIDRDQPVIVLMNWTSAEPYGHYRVVVGYNSTHMIMHDPWNKGTWGGTYGGANTTMTYSEFLDLWKYLDNWALWVHPWSIELQTPSTAIKGENLTVSATITYPCPSMFRTGNLVAFHCNATISLQENLTLASGEETQQLGTIIAENPVQISWLIHADETGTLDISVATMGTIEDTVPQHETYASYSYQDEIGGSTVKSLMVVPEFHSSLILFLFGTITMLTVTAYRKKQ